MEESIDFKKIKNVVPICLLDNYTEIYDAIGFIAGYGRIESTDFCKIGHFSMVFSRKNVYFSNDNNF